MSLQDLEDLVLLGGAAMVAYSSVRNRNYVKSAALTTPERSAWTVMYKNADRQSFISLTGFDRITFNRLHSILYPLAERKIVPGRPKKLDTRAKLGMYLHHMNSTMGRKTLCQLFGVTESTVGRVLKEVESKVLSNLSGSYEGGIIWPNEDKRSFLAGLIERRSPLVKNAFGFVDGLSLPTACSEDIHIQNAYYGGWHSDTKVNNILPYIAMSWNHRCTGWFHECVIYCN